MKALSKTSFILKTSLAGALLLAAAGLISGCGASEEKATGQTVEVKLIATSFEFDKTEIKVKKGDKVKLSFENNQGMHNVEIPDLKVTTAKAGVPVEFVASKAGTFEFKCGIMCGGGHDKMVGKLIVE